MEFGKRRGTYIRAERVAEIEQYEVPALFIEVKGGSGSGRN